MMTVPLYLMLLIFITLVTDATARLPKTAAAVNAQGQPLKSQTFLSPPFFLRPGHVSNKWHYGIEFPRGHLALKSFNGEVVDERGDPVPLHEVYLHHWVVAPYYAAATGTGTPTETNLPPLTMVPEPNAGVCTDNLRQYYGLGSETRRTATWVPDPYGIDIGDPPEGYEERWLINVHAIDTRGVADTLGCTECRCDLYNVTVDERGRGVEEGYTGGLRCCYDGTRCRMDEGGYGAGAGGGGDGEARKLFFRYTVMWVDWSDPVVPVRIYIFDATDRAFFFF